MWICSDSVSEILYEQVDFILVYDCDLFVLFSISKITVALFQSKKLRLKFDCKFNWYGYDLLAFFCKIYVTRAADFLFHIAVSVCYLDVYHMIWDDTKSARYNYNIVTSSFIPFQQFSV